MQRDKNRVAENALLKTRENSSCYYDCNPLVLAGQLESCKGLESTTNLRKIKIKPLIQCLILSV